MTKYRLYIPSSKNSLYHHLLNNDNFIIINEPIYQYVNNKLVTNFDVILYIDDNIDNYCDTLLKISNIKKYGIVRHTKKEQTILLDLYKINHPNTYFFSQHMYENTIASLLNDVNDNELLIIKYDLGARGLGQLLCTKKEYISIVSTDSLRDIFKDNLNKYEPYPVKTVEVDDFNYSIEKNPNENENNKLEKTKILNKFKNIKYNFYDELLYLNNNNKNFIIQKYISHRNEYRMLWFYNNDPIIVQRNIDKDNWQANACNNSEDSSTVININDLIEHKKIEEVIQKINKMMNNLNVPFMSIDIYYDIYNDICGIFEFQMEFGWTNTLNINSNELNNKINKSVEQLILKKQLKNGN